MTRITDQHIVPRVAKQYIDRKLTLSLEPLGLQGSQAQYIMAVSRNPGASMKKVTEYLMVDKSITTRTVGALIHLGLVRNDSENTRQYHLMLTKEGERIVRIIEKALEDIWKDLVSDLTQEELNIFKSVCIKLNTKMKEEAGN